MDPGMPIIGLGLRAHGSDSQPTIIYDQGKIVGSNNPPCFISEDYPLISGSTGSRSTATTRSPFTTRDRYPARTIFALQVIRAQATWNESQKSQAQALPRKRTVPFLRPQLIEAPGVIPDDHRCRRLLRAALAPCLPRAVRVLFGK